MRRTKTMLMGDLLEEFFKRPYIAAKVAEGKLPDTWREIVGDRAAEITTELKIENHILYARIRAPLGAFLPARGAQGGDQPPLGAQAGPCGHHPVTRRPHTKRAGSVPKRSRLFVGVRTDHLMIAARLAFWTLKMSFSSPRPL